MFTLLSCPLHYFPLDLWLQLKLIYDLDSTFSSLSLIVIIRHGLGLGHHRQQVPGEAARFTFRLDSVFTSTVVFSLNWFLSDISNIHHEGSHLVILAAWQPGMQVAGSVSSWKEKLWLDQDPPDLILPSLILNSGQLDDHKGFVAATRGLSKH